MKEHPINEILRTSLSNIGSMVDVSKVVGNPIMLPNNQIAIPITKVTCGFGVGGSEFPKNNAADKKLQSEYSDEIFPFGGGSGGGITINPMALIVISDNKVKLLKIEKDNPIFDKALETIQDIIKK